MLRSNRIRGEYPQTVAGRKITVVSVFRAALAAVHKWGLLGVEHPGQEREKGLVFPNFSDRGGGGGHLYPRRGTADVLPNPRVVLKPLHIFSSLGGAVVVLSCLVVLCCLDEMMLQSMMISSASSL